MQIFISWSGEQSKAVAELLNEWIPCVIQAIKPWISTTEIDKGAVWFNEITNQLKETSVGIVCVTKENRDRPWLLFEAGALLKRVSKNRVCTFLVDLKYTDVKDPLAQFNHTVCEKEDVYKLLKTINDSMESGNLEEPRLRKILETNWPEFETRFGAILKDNAALQTQPDKPKRDPDDIMAEILVNTRQLNKRIGNLEDRLKREEFDKKYVVWRDENGKAQKWPVVNNRNGENEKRTKPSLEGFPSVSEIADTYGGELGATYLNALQERYDTLLQEVKDDRNCRNERED